MSKKQKHPRSSSIGPVNQRVKVLYQNLGGTWYAFADINDEVFFAPITLKAVAPKAEAAAPTKKRLADRHDDAA